MVRFDEKLYGDNSHDMSYQLNSLMTLLRIPYLGRIGSTSFVLPIWQNTVFLIESSEYGDLQSEIISMFHKVF